MSPGVSHVSFTGVSRCWRKSFHFWASLQLIKKLGSNLFLSPPLRWYLKQFQSKAIQVSSPLMTFEFWLTLVVSERDSLCVCDEGWPCRTVALLSIVCFIAAYTAQRTDCEGCRQNTENQEEGLNSGSSPLISETFSFTKLCGLLTTSCLFTLPLHLFQINPV